MMDYLYIDNDMQLSFEGDNKLTNADGVSITSATVEVTVYESDGTTEVDGTTWPISFTNNGDGEYEAVLPSDIELVEDNIYVVKIVAEAGSADASWVSEVKAKYRQE
jgi:hypothetical protein